MFRNILFDLGGLFITVYAGRFEQWLFKFRSPGDNAAVFRQRFNEVHHHYERGSLSTSQFLAELRFLIDKQAEVKDIEQAWNSILGRFSLEDLNWASGLRSNFRTALLSNTNELHRASFEEALLVHSGGRQLVDYFDGVYYSQHLGLRKPSVDAFFRVLELEGWNAEETLFVDDNQENLQSAAELGMGIVLHPCNAPLRLHMEARMDLPFHHFSLLS